MTTRFYDAAYDPKDVVLHMSLVRHGQTACSQADVYCGRHCDPSLTPEGQQMAQALCGELAQTPWDAVYTSPLTRAQQTVWPLATGLGLTPTLVGGLAELDYGDWDGAQKQVLMQRVPEAFDAWLAAPSRIAPPGGESAQMLWRRAHRALMGIASAHSAEPSAGQKPQHVLVVSHKSTLRVALCGLLGLDLDGFRHHFAWPLGARAQLVWTASGPHLVRFCHAPHAHSAGAICARPSPRDLTIMLAAPLDTRCINTIRLLAVDAIERAQSGHPGLPMGAAPMAYVLWTQLMRHSPKDPSWPNRDRFVLSAGHGSMLLYALMHLSGYPLSLDDLKAFRTLRSKTPGHPETFVTPGVEATTGPLGQGFANAVGMAIAERSMAHQYNRKGHTIVDHRTYVLVSDGDVMEGVACEAAALAGHLGLSKLCALYDANAVTLDGPLGLSASENVAKRFEACGWHVITIEDGDHDLSAITLALSYAQAETTRPTLLVVNTTIGFGAPHKAGTSQSHGSPLGEAETRAAKLALGFAPDERFVVPDDVAELMADVCAHGAQHKADWDQAFAAWQKFYPALKAQWDNAHANRLDPKLASYLPKFEVGNAIATRQAGHQILNALAPHVPQLLGGDADLSVSTLTSLQGGEDFNGHTGAGRNLRFGIREHAMGAVLNGLAYHGGLKAYGATFFVFSDYMRPAIRLAALSGLGVIYLWTHDSVGVGEDGPTHQPIEHLMALRAIPNLTVLRPADAVETAQAWQLALAHHSGPVGLVLTRQKVPTLDRTALNVAAPDVKDGVARGAYVIGPTRGPIDGIFLATGSEVHLALEAAATLKAEGWHIRVVSMPSWELFDAQSADYQQSVLPDAITARVSLEAGVSWGWACYVGRRGHAIGIDRFGLSAPGPQVLAELGITADNAAHHMRRVLAAR